MSIEQLLGLGECRGELAFTVQYLHVVAASSDAVRIELHCAFQEKLCLGVVTKSRSNVRQQTNTLGITRIVLEITPTQCIGFVELALVCQVDHSDQRSGQRLQVLELGSRGVSMLTTARPLLEIGQCL